MSTVTVNKNQLEQEKADRRRENIQAALDRGLSWIVATYGSLQLLSNGQIAELLGEHLLNEEKQRNSPLAHE